MTRSSSWAGLRYAAQTDSCMSHMQEETCKGLLTTKQL